MKLTFHFLLLEFPNQEFSVLQFFSGNFLKPFDESQSLLEKINAGIFALKIDKNVLTWTTLFYEQKNPGFARGRHRRSCAPPLPSSCFGRQMLTPLPP